MPVTPPLRTPEIPAAVEEPPPPKPKEIATPIPPEPLQRVAVVDIDMPFRSMVNFMIKWALAAIPAIIGLMALFVAFTWLLRMILPLP
jgi:hypothetical protein